METFQIIHDEKDHEFYCIVEGQKCIVEYAIYPHALEFTHTFVPESLRGRGIARKLYDEIARYLKAHQLKAIPTCSYAEKYFSETEEDHLVQ